MSLAPQIEAMRLIASRARAVRMATLGHAVPSTASSRPGFQVDVADICSMPQPIAADLIALGLRSPVAVKISSAYLRSAHHLKANFEASYARALQKLQEVPGPSKPNPLYTRAMATRYAKSLENWRNTILDSVRERVREIREASRSRQEPEKKSFNTSAIPVLEHAFERNPRPSRAEKRRLAEKTKMEHKQITIWFQNRRNRSKKKASVGCAPDTNRFLPPDLAAALTRILDQFVIPSEYIVAEVDKPGPFDWAASFAPFHADRPRYAWPVSYPPLCDDDPFPLSGDSRRFFTPWYRVPVVSPVVPSVEDESDVLTLLQKLSLGLEDTDWDCGIEPVYATGVIGFMIRPPPAPLPALTYRTSLLQWRQDTSPPGEGLARSHEVAPSSIKVEARPTKPKTLRGRIANVYNAIRRRRTVHLNTPLHPRPPSSAAVATAGDDIRLDALTLALRGRPYPKGKPSQRKPLRAVPTDPCQESATDRAPSSSPSPSVYRRSPEHNTRPPMSPHTALPALSRESSVSSLRSVSSTSSSSSDSDLLLTPPMFPISVLDFPVPDFLTSHQPDSANVVPCKGSAVSDTPRGAAYLGYSMACGNYDPALRMSSALYSQVEPAIPFFPEPPLIPTINPSVLVL